MTTRLRRADAGFTLIEMLIATVLMTVILASLATVTAQWLPNWNRGLMRVQRTERLALGLERIVADLSAAEMIPPNVANGLPVFDGGELAVIFVRAAIGPNAGLGLDAVRMAETADNQGFALVRERASFLPQPPGAILAFANPVVLVRAPYRVSFAYAGPDRVWKPTWRNEPALPSMIRISVRDTASGRLLAASTVASVHVNAAAVCAGGKSSANCLDAGAEPVAAPSPQRGAL
jgi:general secretion pathway protein J